ncbi:glycosyltransferase family 2 protein [Geomesophilobacter sediminis]|uniref:Glycosyltransferase n=1 Tax=Geomesophilobacter sediminis TaxID=2798584 RepID=A0A8J7JB25_9BACT|nr:glycosyltransferase [Geomesophilobacter sediminis]MBJ6724251.1 glycosyltransferase [Geomesophilobacter sediminis]
MNGVSVIIKALNEEHHIEAALRSALEGVRAVGGEVILADSGSTDRTVAIAQGFPVTIVQLAAPEEACCGIGPQLGFQEAAGDFVYLMDGDMELVPGFLEAALAVLGKDASLAGVGGMMEEVGTLNAEYLLRKRMAQTDRQPGPVTHLTGGGLYRVAAVRSVAYFSNRNLHAFEELELGVRLAHAGWGLSRLPRLSIRHHPHQVGSYRLLLRRVLTGSNMGPGQMLKASFGKPYFRRILPRFTFVYVTAGWIALLALVPVLPVPLPARAGAFLAGAGAPFVLLGVRKGGLGAGAYCLLSWLSSLFGAVRGLCRPQVDPAAPVARKVIQVGRRHGQTGP